MKLNMLKKSDRKHKTVSIIIIAMMIAIVFFQIINNDSKSLSGEDSDSDGLIDDLECGITYDTWECASGDIYGSRSQYTTIPSIDDEPNYLWGKILQDNVIQTIPLMYDNGIIIGCYDEDEETSTILYLTENVGHILWSISYEETKVLDILIEDTNDYLVVFYEDLQDDIDATKMFTFSLDNPFDEDEMIYWPCEPGDDTVEYIINLEGDTNEITDLSYACHPITFDGEVYFCAEFANTMYFIGISLDNIHYELDGDYITRTFANITAQASLGDYGIMDANIWKIVGDNYGNFFIGVNNEEEYYVFGMLIKINDIGVVLALYSPSPSAIFSDVVYINKGDPNQDIVITLFDNRIRIFNNMLTELDNYNILADIDQSCYIPVGIPAMAQIQTLPDQPIEFVVFSTYDYGGSSQEPPGEFTYKEILWYEINITNSINYNTITDIDSDIEYNIPLLSVNIFVGIFNGLYLLDKDDTSGDYFISLYNTTASGPEYSITNDAPGFILANHKMIVNTYVYNSTTSSFIPTLKCYGGWSTDNNLWDTDDDGIRDGTIDLDEDGDYEGNEIGEIVNATLEVAAGYGTDPCRADTDGDGLEDGEELMDGWDITGTEITVYSDPLDPDSDDDNLGDFFEWYFGLDPEYYTTDTDELSDYGEIFSYWTVKKDNDIDEEISEVGNVVRESYDFDDDGDIEYGGSYWIKYTGSFAITGDSTLTGKDIIQSIRDDVTLINNSQEVDDSDDTYVFVGVFIDDITVVESTYLYIGSFYYSYHFDIPTDPDQMLWINTSCGSGNDFSGTDEYLNINSSVLQRRGLISEFFTLDEEDQLDYSSCDIDYDGLYDGPTDPDTDGEGMSDLYEFELGSSPMDDSGDFDGDGITDADEVSLSHGTKDVNLAWGKTAGTDFIIDSQKRITGIEESSYYYTRTGIYYTAGTSALLDGNMSTYWFSEKPPTATDAPMIIVDLQHYVYVNTIPLISDVPFGPFNPDDFEISCYTGHFWKTNYCTDLTQDTNYSVVESAGYYDITITFDKVWTRYLEINFTSSVTANGNILIRELEVFGPAITLPGREDTDGDGFSDYDELEYGGGGTNALNPVNQDTDGDGLPDGWIDGWDYHPITGWFLNFSKMDEIIDPWEGEDVDCDSQVDTFTYQSETVNETEPDEADTDEDGMPDGWERYHGFDPTNAADASMDYDDDNLDNLDEYIIGTDPENGDSDNDGLDDGDEFQDIKLRTSLDNGIISIDNALYIEDGDWIMYDPTSIVSQGEELYVYKDLYRDVKIGEEAKAEDMFTLGLFQFDDQNETVAFDSSYWENDLAISGAEKGSGRFSGGLVLDGLNDYAWCEHDSTLAPEETITISAWILPTSITGTRTIVIKENSYYLEFTSGNLQGGIYIDSTEKYVSTTVSEDIWHYVELVYDGTYLTLYVDGLKEHQISASGDIDNVATNLNIGGSSQGYFEGTLDEIMISNIPRPNPDSIVFTDALWHFDSINREMQDISGNVISAYAGSDIAKESSDPTTTIDGYLGDAIVFDGVNDMVTIEESDKLDFYTTMTAEAWIYAEDDDQGTVMPIFFKDDIFSLFLTADGSGSFSLTGEAWEDYVRYHVTTDYLLEAETWYLVSLVVDSGNVLRLYINGIEAGNVSLPGKMDRDELEINIGGNGTSNYFEGAIDEVRLSRSPYPTYFGNPELPIVDVIAYLEDGSKVLKADFDDDDYDRLFIRENPTDLEEESETIFEGMTYEFLRDDDNQAIPENDAKSDSPVLAYRNQEWYVGDPLGTDTDKDGIPDGNESSPYADTDTDGFINMDDIDSDDDGMTDYDEDLDHDGIFDTSVQEDIREPNPLDSDSDDDGLLDGEENTLVNSYSPERNEEEDFDSDGDGITDFYDTDSDNDGIDDDDEVGEDGEYDIGDDPCPVDPDTDGDGLLDGSNVSVSDEDQIEFWDEQDIHSVVEGSNHIYVGEDSVGTEPLEDDTDEDGLVDGEEFVDYSWWFDCTQGTGEIEHTVLTVDPGTYHYYVKARSIAASPDLDLIVKLDGTSELVDQEDVTTTLTTTEDEEPDGLAGGYHWYGFSFTITGEVEKTIALKTNTADVRVVRGLLVEDGEITNGSLKYGGNYATTHTLFEDGGGIETIYIDLAMIEDDIEYFVQTATIEIELNDPYLNASYLTVGDSGTTIWISDGLDGGSTYSVELAWAINTYQYARYEETILFPLNFHCNGSVDDSGAINITIDEIILEPVLSDPLNTDTDEDNITDSKEREVYLTSSMRRDTDDDGIQDPVEMNDLHANRRDTILDDVLYDSTYTVVEDTDEIIEGDTYYLQIPRDDGLIGTMDLSEMTTEHGGYSIWKDYSYELTPSYAQGSACVGASDFDLDGWADVVGYSSTKLIFTYGGEGEFTESHTESIAGITDFAVGDINRDGYDDVISVTTSAGTYASINDEGDDFDNYQFTEYSGTKYKDLGDLNGDGYLDMVISHWDRDEIVTRFYDIEQESYITKTTYTVNDPYDITSADFDHDGNADVAVINYQDSEWGITVLLNDGDGTLAEVVDWGKSFHSLDSLEVTSADQIIAGDLDNDGWDDIVVTHHLDDIVSILWNDEGEFDEEDITTVEIDGPEYVAIADLDVDGWNELIISNMTYTIINPDPLETYTMQHITVFRNTRDRSFDEYLFVEGIEDEDAGAVTTADFDMDGSLDIIYLRYNTIVTANRITLRHVDYGSMNLTTAYGYVSVTVNFKDDIFPDFTMNITSDGEDDHGITTNLAHYLNSYLYTFDYRLDDFTSGLITIDYIKIPLTFEISGPGCLKIKETTIELTPISTSATRSDTDYDRIVDGNEMWAENTTTQDGGAYPVFTNPRDSDTDSDSLIDGREDANFNGLVDWTDYNEDGMLNDGSRISWSDVFLNETEEGSDLNTNNYANEIITELIETDPLDQDTDEDGLTEKEEVRGFRTDPLLTDSDHDMVFDGTEVGRFVNTLADVYNIPQDTVYDAGSMAHDDDATNGDQYIYGDHDTANKPSVPMCLDSDEDDIYDGYNDTDEDRSYDPGENEVGEDFNGNGRVDWSIGETDPMNPDVDDDGIRDGDELIFGTSKYDADTDDDGLSDYAEIFIHGTNASNPDTDGDMLSDGLELGVQTGVWTANAANGENQNRYPLVNGNFESGSASWTCGQNHEVYSSIQYSHTGFQCLRATGEDTTYQDSIQVSMERIYRISGYIRKGDADDVAQISITDPGEVTTLFTMDLEVEEEDEYVFWKGYFETLTNPMIKFKIYTNNSENVYIDNIHLDKVINNTDNTNGNFSVDTDLYSNTDPNDSDSDDDMLYDGWFDADGGGDHDTGEYGEDVNGNGKVDSGDWGSGGETDPNSKDTDEDDMPDNWEHNFNGYEDTTPITIWLGNVQYDYLDPLVDDAYDDLDSDYLTNIVEYWYDQDNHKLNPSNTDSDGDGMPDEWEYNFSSELDLLVDDANQDPDDDGINNINEYNLMGASPDSGRLDPLNFDTDNDGVPDGAESYDRQLVYSGKYIYTDFYFKNTNNVNWYQDLDNDGLINALDFDSDNDTLSDYQELTGMELKAQIRIPNTNVIKDKPIDINPRLFENGANYVGDCALDPTDSLNEALDTDDDKIPDYKESNPRWYYSEYTNDMTTSDINAQFNPVVVETLPPIIDNLKVKEKQDWEEIKILGEGTGIWYLKHVWVTIEGDIYDIAGVQDVIISIDNSITTRIPGNGDIVLHFKTNYHQFDVLDAISIATYFLGIYDVKIIAGDLSGKCADVTVEKAGIVMSMVNDFRDFMGDVWEAAKDAANALKNALLEKIWGEIKNAIDSLLSPVLDVINQGMETLAALIKNTIMIMYDMFQGIPVDYTFINDLTENSMIQLLLTIGPILMTIHTIITIASAGFGSIIMNLAIPYLADYMMDYIQNANQCSIEESIVSSLDLNVDPMVILTSFIAGAIPDLTFDSTYIVVSSIVSMFAAVLSAFWAKDRYKDVIAENRQINENNDQAKSYDNLRAVFERDVVLGIDKLPNYIEGLLLDKEKVKDTLQKAGDDILPEKDEFEKKRESQKEAKADWLFASLGMVYSILSSLFTIIDHVYSDDWLPEYKLILRGLSIGVGIPGIGMSVLSLLDPTGACLGLRVINLVGILCGSGSIYGTATMIM